jgi:small subunit ribosomal protein S20
MPITSSAIKKAKQDIVARRRNRVIRDEYKSASKKVRRLALAGDLKKAQEALTEAYSKIDIAAKKKVLHKNNASRRKSRLAALIKKDAKETKVVAAKKTTKKESK